MKLELGKTYLVRGGDSGRAGQRGVLVDLNGPELEGHKGREHWAPVLDFGDGDLAHVRALDLEAA